MADVCTILKFRPELVAAQGIRGTSADRIDFPAFEPAPVLEYDGHEIERRVAWRVRVLGVVGNHDYLAHQLLYILALNEVINQFRQAGPPRDHARGQGEFHTELRLQTGLRLMVAQHLGIAPARHGRDALDLVGLERMLGQQVQHPVQAAVRAKTQRILLD